MGFLDSIKAMFGGTAPKSPEELAHLQAIGADPENLDKRLAYAAFLEGQKDPLGEFIRLDIELSKLADHDPRRAELQNRSEDLMGKHGRKWVKPFKELELEPLIIGMYVPGIWFNRGMIEQITIDKRAAVPGKMERMVELAPALRKLTFERCSPDWGAIATSPLMARIKALELSDVKLSLLEIQSLLGSPYLKQLEELDLANKEYGAELAGALAKSTQVKQLKALVLSSCELGPAGVKVLASEQNFAGLTKLNLSYNRIGDEGAAAIGKSATLGKLVSLNLNSNDLKTAGVQAIAKGPFAQLQELELESSEPGVAGMQALAAARFAGSLTALNVGWNRAGDEAIAALLRPASFRRLRKLNLNGSDLSAGGLKQVLDSDSLATVAELDLSSNEIGSAGVAALLAAPKLKQLQRLVLYSVEMTDSDKSQLRQKFGEDGVQC